MKRRIFALFAAACLLASLCLPAAAEFTDVSEDTYYYAPVLWAQERGVTTGASPDAFLPDAACTRAQTLTLLWRAAGSLAPESGEAPFADMPEELYYDAVLWAAERGIARGIGVDRFAPSRSCTRAEVVTFLWRAAGSPLPDASQESCPFADVGEDYYREAVLWAAENGITVGTAPDRFSPNVICTRAQVVTLLYRAVTAGALFTQEEAYQGYLAAAATPEGFLAVGTGGRLDAIGLDGSVTHLESHTGADLTDLWTDGSRYLVSCADGSVLLSTDGARFDRYPAVPDGGLCGAVRYRGSTYAATYDGRVLKSNDLERWSVVYEQETFGFTHLAATNYGLVLINEQTDVLLSADGLNWTHENFNEVYRGLYPTYVFHALIGAGDTFFVLGFEQDRPEVPLIMYTEQMEVWMQLGLNMIDDEVPDYETTPWRVNDLCFHPDQVLAACDAGRLLAMPGCSVCNRSLRLPDAGSLRCIALNENSVLAAGEDFYCSVLSVLELRQDHIRAEQARQDVLERGAVIIDVREAREREQSGWIPGSLHIPLGQLTQRLPELIPERDTELIFYCASGYRAQTALETAIELGYYYVYNLGGLKDWPYELEH